ncbi:MAG: sulfatase [Myxococcota bacterium]|jgi:arylsulfatase|nr:sulfatase [Myxococcota bacterium]
MLKLNTTCFAFLALLFSTVAEARPNEIIFLTLVDAMRPDHMGSYGYDKPTSPNMDALAKVGKRYTRVYVNAPWTRPSTASFLTGQNASRHRTETAKTKLPKDVRTLAQHLKQAGWTTAGFVANGNGGSLAGLQKGFDVFRDPTNTYTKKVRGKTYNGLPTGEFLIARTLEWLEDVKADKLFVFLFLVDPHDPYYAPPELEKKFLGNHKGKIRRRALWEYDNDYSLAERQSMLAIYDAGIAYADLALGQLFDGLKRMKLYDKSTFLISADHGEGFGEHGFYLHAHHFWEEVIKVPLIVAGPKITPGVDDRLADSLDVVATVAELAGTPWKSIPGKSMLGPKEKNPRVISEYNEFGIRRQAIIGPRYKVIWQRPADEAWFNRYVKDRKYFPSVSFDKDVVQVFDLQADPLEQKDLSKDMPKEAKALLEELKAFVFKNQS